MRRCLSKYAGVRVLPGRRTLELEHPPTTALSCLAGRREKVANGYVVPRQFVPRHLAAEKCSVIYERLERGRVGDAGGDSRARTRHRRPERRRTMEAEAVVVATAAHAHAHARARVHAHARRHGIASLMGTGIASLRASGLPRRMLAARGILRILSGTTWCTRLRPKPKSGMR